MRTMKQAGDSDSSGSPAGLVTFSFSRQRPSLTLSATPAATVSLPASFDLRSEFRRGHQRTEDLGTQPLVLFAHHGAERVEKAWVSGLADHPGRGCPAFRRGAGRHRHQSRNRLRLPEEVKSEQSIPCNTGSRIVDSPLENSLSVARAVAPERLDEIGADAGVPDRSPGGSTASYRRRAAPKQAPPSTGYGASGSRSRGESGPIDLELIEISPNSSSALSRAPALRAFPLPAWEAEQRHDSLVQEWVQPVQAAWPERRHAHGRRSRVHRAG